jgi:hypothetical protein
VSAIWVTQVKHVVQYIHYRIEKQLRILFVNCVSSVRLQIEGVFTHNTEIVLRDTDRNVSNWYRLVSRDTISLFV